MKILLFIVLTTSLFSIEPIAIIEFEGIGVNLDETRTLTQRLRTEMISLEIYKVFEKSEMERLLAQVFFQHSGCVDLSCAVEIGKMLGLRYVIIGSISQLGSTFSIDARMIDVETSEPSTTAKYDYTGGIEHVLKEGMNSIANQLCELEQTKAIELEQTKAIEKNTEGGWQLVIFLIVTAGVWFSIYF